ncbi:hypothetical protein F4561_002192 [Lipingzhangella halophila]|uniref:Uncharacterized protein n=1 Tax=Lipingzhangella halophila TaxID=1783352 RepID=A0A7W7RGB1_9ACTN|nr:hypothetical protein [Lipingzhangella halophila]MBB4931372.1 hypothetical protein [Lipingzhangella halophila]
MSNDDHNEADPDETPDDLEPDFEEIGEIGGEIINEAAAQNHLGAALDTAGAFAGLSSIYQSNGMSSMAQAVNRAMVAVRPIVEASYAEQLANTIKAVYPPKEHPLQEVTRQALRAQSSLPSSLLSSSLASSLGEITDFTESIAGLSRTINWSGFLRKFPDIRQLLLPSNLVEIDDKERVDELRRVIDEDGTSLAWAPRAEIVMELLDAADMDERDRILQERTLDVIEDVEKSLANVAHPDTVGLREVLEEACVVGRQPAYVALQATATNAADTVMGWITSYLGNKWRSQTQKYFQCDVENLEDARLGELRLYLIGGGTQTAFNKWDEDKGGLPGYSRHGSAHHMVSASKPAHALRALLLTQALLRWINSELEADDEDADTE